jgi:cytochrome c553
MLIQTSALLLCAVFSSCLCAAPAETLTQSCVACHGASGVSTRAGTPHLNGQLSDYLEQEIGGLVQGGPGGSVPQHVPAGWSAQDIATVAQFYAGSRAARAAQSTDPARLAKGRALYQQRCADCHPDNGRESNHDAPLLAAQNLEYMMEQTRAFVSGKRKYVFMMDEAFGGLSPDELDSITHFFASQSQFKP